MQAPFSLAALALTGLLASPSAHEIEPLKGSVAPKLPPLVEGARAWNGKSRGLIAKPEDPWVTPSERTGLTGTPRYDETLAWLRSLVAAAPELSLQSLGKSEEGRDIWMVIASRERAFGSSELRRAGKPSLLAQAGIHAGEIDGKDAGLMLLRDMTVGGSKRELLDRANFLFIPILNVDGHERSSPYGRINQRGPVEMGWRTNAKNLNLNRDYAKLDTPEVRAVVAAINAYEPDLYFDLEVYSAGTSILGLLSFARNRYGFYRTSARFKRGIFTDLVYFNIRMPVARIYNQLHTAAGGEPIDPNDLGPITVKPEDVSGMTDKLAAAGIARDERFIVLNPNASDLLLERRWPRAHDR